MKRAISIILALILLLVSAVGCGGTANGNPVSEVMVIVLQNSEQMETIRKTS